MNALISVLTAGVLLGVNIASAESLVSPPLDHLAPVNPKDSPKYRKLLASKLAVTPSNCGRAMLWPPFAPEGCIAVYWISSEGRRTYRVTSTDTAENLWQRTDAAHYADRAKGVRVRRLDAEIPERTALLVREVWLRMLEDVKPLPPETAIDIDGTTAEFSLQKSNGRLLLGELKFSFSFPGRKTKRLVDIWNALYDYCKATPEKRSPIANQIERKAALLLATLSDKA